jgi:hypothetical protein
MELGGSGNRRYGGVKLDDSTTKGKDVHGRVGCGMLEGVQLDDDADTVLGGCTGAAFRLLICLVDSRRWVGDLKPAYPPLAHLLLGLL